MDQLHDNRRDWGGFRAREKSGTPSEISRRSLVNRPCWSKPGVGSSRGERARRDGEAPPGPALLALERRQVISTKPFGLSHEHPAPSTGHDTTPCSGLLREASPSFGCCLGRYVGNRSSAGDSTGPSHDPLGCSRRVGARQELRNIREHGPYDTLRDGEQPTLARISIGGVQHKSAATRTPSPEVFGSQSLDSGSL